MGAARSIWDGWRPRGRWSEAAAAVSRMLHGEKKHPFDRAHGVDTGGLIYAAGEQARHNAGYYATAPSLFRGAMGLWRETLAGTGFGVEDYTLVDIGCGKGRVLMMATEYPFREIVGVELDPGLARIVRKNLRKWMIRTRARARVRIIEADALALVLPDVPVALFYFNSFERELTGQWLSRLAALARIRTAPLDLIYVHPEFDALVRQLLCIQALAQADLPFSEEDGEADVFGVSSDQCAVYRLG
jgi:SAM-dependent methyltransferase